MNSISYFSHIFTPSLFSENLNFLSSQHKRILAIALLAFSCVAAIYVISRFCCSKAEVLDGSEDEETPPPPPPFYSPKNLKHEPSINQIKDPLSIVRLTKSLNTRAPIYEVTIHPLEDNLRYSDFKIKNYNINDRTLEFLIEYGSSKNPEIQAFWNETENKLYVVGGKWDPSVKISPGHFIFADHHQAWIRIDLNRLPRQGPIEIYGKLPGLNVFVESNKTKQILAPKDELLMTLI